MMKPCQIGPSFEDADTARLVADYLVKTIPFCSDHGVDVIDASGPLPEGFKKSVYSSRYVLVTDEYVRSFAMTMEHISHCATDFTRGLLAGIKLAEERAASKAAAAATIEPKVKKRMCPACRSFKGMHCTDKGQTTFLHLQCNRVFKSEVPGGMLFEEREFDSRRNNRATDR